MLQLRNDSRRQPCHPWSGSLLAGCEGRWIVYAFVGSTLESMECPYHEL